MTIAKNSYSQEYRYPYKWILGLLFCLSSLISVPVVALFENEKGLLWQRGKETIKLVDSQSTNTHPLKLEPRLIATALRAIKINVEGGFFNADKQRSLFSESVAKTLGYQLAIGLAQARVDQDIVFSIVDKTQDKFFSEMFSSGGRVFYRDGALHLIVGDALLPFEGVKDVRKGDSGMLKLARPGNRERVYLSPKITFSKSAGMQFSTLNGSMRGDWLIMDIERMVQASIDWYKPNNVIENEKQAELTIWQPEHSPKVQKSLLEELARLRQEITELKTRCP